MTSHPASAYSEDCSPTEWLLRSYNPDPVAFQQMPLPQIFFHDHFPSPLPYSWDELHPVENQPNAQLADVSDQSTSAVHSPPIPLPLTLPHPQPVAVAPPEWHIVPQRLYRLKQSNYIPSESIPFQADGFPGINMGDALRKQFAALKGRDDLVMDGAKKAFSCRFLFIGYPDRVYQIPTKFWGKTREAIPRSKLAHEVAKRLEKYLDSMVNHTIDSPVDRRWEIGEGFMHLDNIYLAKLESVTKGSYQPLFYVVDRSCESPATG